jgi:hypothetical protein
MPVMVTNEDGEPIGFDYPEYDSDWGDDLSDDYGRDYGDEDEETSVDGPADPVIDAVHGFWPDWREAWPDELS